MINIEEEYLGLLSGTLHGGYDKPDRTGTGTKSVTYTQAYLTVPALGFAVQNLASGDTYTITNKTNTGFDVAFVNSSSSGVSRTFDFIAKGF